MAGRPRKFDPDKALEEAMKLFWLNGYEATGLQQLLKKMGIGYQSLYNTYGNKHSLYLDALRRYDEWTRHRLRDALEAPGSALENIHQVMNSWTVRAKDPEYIGCFISVSVAELAIHDEEVAEITRRHLSGVETLFLAAIKRASDAHELTTDLSPRELARFLVHSVRGLEVLAKAGMGPAVTKDVLKVVLSVVN